MVYFKSGVRIDYLTPALFWILDSLDMWSDENTKDLTVTSIFDGIHAKNSRHYRGEAVDVRSHNLTSSMKDKFSSGIVELLGKKFTLLFENPGADNEHFHIQVKKGISFP